MKIYIVDYLGIHCGMHYYNDAFKKVLSSISGLEVSILSNYASDDTKKPFFRNQYRGSKWQKLYSLFVNYKRLLHCVLCNKDVCFVYLTYGNRVDLPFMWTLSFAKKYIIDIHEAIGQNVDTNLKLKRFYKNIYSKQISNVIVHSQRTNDFLDEYNYSGNRLFVPHFKYCFKKDYTSDKIDNRIKEVIRTDKVNLLFFGNINYNKGIDILITAINNLPEEHATRLNVIIAGKDIDGSIHNVFPENKNLFHIVLKHIEDDELVYLYEKTDYVTLPYRKTSQSGILEMAFYFQKPIVASKIPYFKKMLTEFPSFGILSDTDPVLYAQTISKILEEHGKKAYFQKQDYERYIQRKEIDTFKVQFNNWINN